MRGAAVVVAAGPSRRRRSGRVPGGGGAAVRLRWLDAGGVLEAAEAAWGQVVPVRKVKIVTCVSSRWKTTVRDVLHRSGG